MLDPEALTEEERAYLKAFFMEEVFPLLTPLAASAQAWSAPRTVYVPTTGHTTDGLFLDLWRAERTLLGDPVTEEFRARTGFQRWQLLWVLWHIGSVWLFEVLEFVRGSFRKRRWSASSPLPKAGGLAQWGSSPRARGARHDRDRLPLGR